MAKNQKLKVLMLGWELPPHYSGGLGVISEGIARALHKKGLSVILVLPRRLPFPPLHYIDELHFIDDYIDINLIQKVKTPSSYSSFNPNDPLNSDALDLYELVRCYSQAIHHIVEKVNFDIIHAHDWLTFGAGMNAKELSGKPLVAHIHSTIFDRSLGHTSMFESSLEYEGLAKADRIIAVSQFTKNLIVNNYNLKSELIDVVHNALDYDNGSYYDIEPIGALKEFKKKGYKIVVSLGRITLQKGIENMLDVAQGVLQLFPNVIFVVAGEGDCRKEVIQKAATLGIGTQVLFPGWANRMEANGYFKHSDLFIMPSLSEPFGIVGLEAIMHDTPVLTTKSSGLSEVLPINSSIDYWDVDRWVNEIYAMLSNDEQRTQMLLKERRATKNLLWDNQINLVIESYYKSLE